MSASTGSRALILVDGRSGAGKTQWARQKQEETGFFLLSLDEVYPGWDGLAAGSQMVYRRGILPWLAGEAGAVPAWNWVQSAPGGWIEIDPNAGLIIEGCGAISSHSAAVSTERWWIEAADDARRERVFERDGDVSRPHWERWALQERRFYALHRSRERAQQIVEN